MICIKSRTILLMEEKRIPKKLEKAKDSNGIPSGGQWGVPGEESGASKAPGVGSGWAGLRGCSGKGKQNPVLGHLT